MRPSIRFFLSSANLINAGIPLALAPSNHAVQPFLASSSSLRSKSLAQACL